MTAAKGRHEPGDPHSHTGSARRPVNAGGLPLVVGLAPLRVGLALLTASRFAMTLGCLGLAEHLGRVRRLTLGASGSFVRGRGTVVRPPTVDLVVLSGCAHGV